MKVAVVGNEQGSVAEALLKIIAVQESFLAPTCFKDLETGEITSIMPENKMFEMTKQIFDEDFKSGKEKRRERRKQERKKK